MNKYIYVYIEINIAEQNTRRNRNMLQISATDVLIYCSRTPRVEPLKQKSPLGARHSVISVSEVLLLFRESDHLDADVP